MLRHSTLSFLVLLSVRTWVQAFVSDCANRVAATASLLQVPAETQSATGELKARNHTDGVISSQKTSRVDGEVRQAYLAKPSAWQHDALASSKAAAGREAALPEILSCSLLRGSDPAGNDDRVTCSGRSFAPVDDGVTRTHIEVSSAVTGIAAIQTFQDDIGPVQWYIYVFCCVCCVVCAAMAAGLTMGLVSLEEFNLNLMLEMRPQDLNTLEEREALAADQEDARAVKPIISGNFFGKESSVPAIFNPTNHHYVLVTLLVVNAIANEALPVFLDDLVNPLVAVLISVVVVLLFGEIIPSAIFTGPRQLSIAAKFAGVVEVLKIIVFPIVWPVSLALDSALGHEAEEDFSRGKIKALTRLKRRRPSGKLSPKTLHVDEVNIIHGALDLHNRTVADIQKKMEKAKSVPDSAVLDGHTMANILHMAHSRIFVHGKSPQDIRGVLLVKRLITLNPDDSRPMSKVHLRKPLVFSGEEDLLEAINRFQEGHSHLALISSDPEAVKEAWKSDSPIPEHAWPVGFLALEDIVEQVLQEEVYDATMRWKGRNFTNRRCRAD